MADLYSKLQGDGHKQLVLLHPSFLLLLDPSKHIWPLTDLFSFVNVTITHLPLPISFTTTPH